MTATEGADFVDRFRGALPEGVSISAGVAASRPGESPSDLLHRADLALYEAKANGRGRTAVAREIFAAS
jgi:PleD family two-component response regulator